jgi:hypothetical protein
MNNLLLLNFQDTSPPRSWLILSQFKPVHIMSLPTHHLHIHASVTGTASSLNSSPVTDVQTVSIAEDTNSTKTQTMELHVTLFSTTPSNQGAGTAQSVKTLGYGMGDPGFEYRQTHEMFLSSKTSRPVLGPTPPPIQWIPEFFPKETWPGREVDHSPPATAQVKNEWRHTCTPPISLHGVNR